MRRILPILTISMLLLAGTAGPAAALDDPVVRGIFFYSPNCGHCHKVIEDDLPDLFEAHGGALETDFHAGSSDPAFTLLSNGTIELLMVNVSIEAGAALYDAATTDFQIPAEMQGVPRLVMGNGFAVGGNAVPADLRLQADEAMESSGLDWPDVTGLDAVLSTFARTEPEPTEASTTLAPTAATPEEPTTTTTSPFPIGSTPGGSDGFGEPLHSIGDKFRNDIPGNSLAVVVLAGMLASLVAVWILVRKGRLVSSPVWLIPVLAVFGALVAIYLTYVESSGAEAVCGPVGDCNAVQESKFALLFGIVHVGLVGLISYIVVFATWLVSRLTRPPLADWARVALALGAAGGVAFSIYLTFLEPFVIGATCIWCISSALIVSALLWLTAGPGWAAWTRLREAA